MNRQAILLNGPSSSGKSTLAAALKALILEKCGEPYEVVSIDDFMKCSPMETIYEDDVYEISGDLCEKALELLRSGRGVIIDHVITSRRIYDQLGDMLRPYPVRPVRVTCPLRILRKRELERRDRCPGSAEASARYLYPKKGYELSVSTESLPPSENAAKILEKVFGAGVPADDPSRIRLVPMTREMLHRYFMEYENDPDLFLDKEKFTPYVYSEERVEQYIRRQADLKRINLGIMLGDEIIGQIIIKNIEEHRCATLGLSLRNARWKDHGYGTQAEKLVIRYVFGELDIPVLYADAIQPNTRSQHVLEKAGFRFIREDSDFKYYRIDRDP